MGGWWYRRVEMGLSRCMRGDCLFHGLTLFSFFLFFFFFHCEAFFTLYRWDGSVVGAVQTA